VLISAAVQQEVQFAFKSFPRLWFQDTLMYEPLEVAGEAAGDEWMYELRRMQDDDSSYNASTLLPLFMMVRSGDPPESIQKAVSDFRVQHTTNLGIKDVASLDHLVQSLAVCPLPSSSP